MIKLRLEDQIDMLERKLMDAQIDLNVKDEYIRQLEKDLEAARLEIRGYELGTQTMRKLAILDDSDDDTGFDPRQSGIYRKNTWEKVR